MVSHDAASLSLDEALKLYRVVNADTRWHKPKLNHQ